MNLRQNTWNIVWWLNFVFILNFAVFKILFRPYKDTIPLWAFASPETLDTIRTLIPYALLLTLPSLFAFSRQNWPYLIVTALGVLECLVNYTNSAAFYQLLPHASLLLLIFKNARETERATMSRINIAVVLISAAVLKINADFLSGAEFLPDGDFAIVVQDMWVRDTVLGLGPAFFLFVIAFEFFLGLLALKAHPKNILWTSLFPLAIIFIAPLTAFSTLSFLPYIVLAVFESRRISRNQYLATVLLISAFTTLCFYLYHTFVPLQPPLAGRALQVIATILTGALVIFRFRKTDYLRTKDTFDFSGRVALWTLLIVGYVATAHFKLLPPPLGYSMYSALNRQNYVLQLDSTQDCKRIQNHYNTHSWAVRMLPQPTGCQITHFSRSPLEDLIQREGLEGATISNLPTKTTAK